MADSDLVNSFSQRDEFGRTCIAENIIKLFESDVEISPLILDGAWGSGKTEFCLKLVTHSRLKKAKAVYIYVDAFRYDHTEDPIILLVSAITRELDKAASKELVDKVIPVLKALSKLMINTAITWAFRQGADKIQEDFKAVASKQADDVVNASVNKIFSEFEKAEENLKAFQDVLTEIAKEKPLVIIIDELDRCRPAFALALLEKLKHVFNVVGVRFVLSTNLAQLNASIKKQYGQEIDSKNYLEKFYKYIIRLPNEVNNYEKRENSFILIEKLLNQDDNFAKVTGHSSPTLELFKYLFQIHKRSLRDVEKFNNNLKIYQTLSGQSWQISQDIPRASTTLLMLGVYIYTFENELALSVASGNFNLDQIASFFNLDKEILLNEESTDKFEEEIFMLLILELKDFPKYVNQGTAKFAKINHELNQVFGNRYGRGERIRILQNVMKTLQFIK